DVIDVEQARVNSRHDGAQPPLAFDERSGSQVFVIDFHEIEGGVVRPVSPQHQRVEPGATVWRETDDFAVEDCGSRAHRMGDLFIQQRPFRKIVTATRDQATDVAANLRERAEAAQFQLVEPGVVIKGFRNLDERHRRMHLVGNLYTVEAGKSSLTKAMASDGTIVEPSRSRWRASKEVTCEG